MNQASKNTHLPYRRGVGMLIISNDKKVFVGKRVDSKNNSWQMPQGGIDGEETIHEAVIRETFEETGIKNFEILAESSAWHYYDLPESLVPRFWSGQYRGQKQKWVLLKFTGDDQEINIHQSPPEFLRWKWIEVEALPDVVIPFKRQLYISVIEEFAPFIAKI